MMLLRMLEAEASAYSTQRLEITDYWIDDAVSMETSTRLWRLRVGGRSETKKRGGGPIVHPWIYFRVPRQLRVYILWSSGKSCVDYVIFLA